MTNKKLGFVLLAALGAGCGGSRHVVLVPQVVAGPAQGARPAKVLVVSAQCGSVQIHCPDSYAATVDEIVRGGLEFDGYAVVDPSALRLDPRTRHEQVETTTETSEGTTVTTDRPLGIKLGEVETASHNLRVTEKKTVVLDGSSFDDLPIGERQTLMQQAGADAVLSTRIVVGAEHGLWTPNQEVEVLVKLGIGKDDSMAWASRCSASSNDFATVGGALEHAARCAIYGATGQQPYHSQP